MRVRVCKGHAMTPGWIMAIVDSGSPYCLFRADIALAIGIKNLTTGKAHEIGGVKKGAVDIYYFHNVKLFIEGNWVIEVMAGFSASLSVPALLGRNGFYDNFIVNFDHSASPPVMSISKIDKVQ